MRRRAEFEEGEAAPKQSTRGAPRKGLDASSCDIVAALYGEEFEALAGE